MDSECFADRSSAGVARRGARAAWSMFWQEPGQLQCVAGAPEVAAALSRHWSVFAETLAPGARVLDLGCGAGAVARALLAQRGDISITGIDFARIPLALRHNVELIAETAMEALPFADASFAAVTSQFGFEYSDIARAACEMTRVLAPGGRFSFLVHHSGSGVVTDNLARKNAISALLSDELRAPFLAGDATAFARRLATLRESYPGDVLVRELAQMFPARLSRAERERAAIWTAVEDALAPERRLLAELRACAVSPEHISDWLAPLRAHCMLYPLAILHEANGASIAWRIGGERSA